MNELTIQNAIRLVKIQFPEIHFSSDFNDTKTEEEVKVNLGYGILFSDTETQQFVVEFKLNLMTETIQSEIKMIAVFETDNNIDEAFKNSAFVQLNAPAIAFPYLRSFITTLSTNAGFKPIILPTINLSKK